MAAQRPYVDFQQVKRNIRLIEAAQVLGVAEQFRELKPGKKWKAVCPLPSHKHGLSPNPDQFRVDYNEQTNEDEFYCFGDCGSGGDIIRFVALMLACDYAQTRFWFAQHFGDRLNLKKPTVKDDAPRPKRQATAQIDGLPPKAAALPAARDESAAPVPAPAAPAVLKPLRFYLNVNPNVEYLDQRGVLPETRERYGIGLAAKGLMANYVVTPIHHRIEGQWHTVGYLGRWPGQPDNEHPRYKLPKDFPKSETLFGGKQAVRDEEKVPYLIVTEGAFGLFHIVQAGFPHAVATLGAHVSPAQAEVLVQFTDRVILMYDGDTAGQAGQGQAVETLIDRCFVRAVQLPEDRQPDDLSPDELRAHLGFLLPVVEVTP